MIDTQSYPKSCFLGLNNTNLWIIKDNNMKTFRKGKIFEAKLISNVSITKIVFPAIEMFLLTLLAGFRGRDAMVTSFSQSSH